MTRIEVLLMEDNPGDARLTQETCRDVNKAIHLDVVSDGMEGMTYLRRQAQYSLAPRPVLILLDLNLPRMDGRAFLTWIKQDSDLKTIPIVILTTSDAESDISMCYQLHANCYLTKPVLLANFEGVIRSINDFWLTKVKLMTAIKP